MKHHLRWNDSVLHIRCWSCGRILLKISSDGTRIDFDSDSKSLEIGCPFCHSSGEYSLFPDQGALTSAHEWEPDTDRRQFEGPTGEENRGFLKQYKMKLAGVKNPEKVYKLEFEIVADFLEFISEKGKMANQKEPDMGEEFIKESFFPSKSSREIARRAINRFYKLIEVQNG